MATSKGEGARGWTLPRPGGAARLATLRPHVLASRGLRQRGSCVWGAGPARVGAGIQASPPRPGHLGPRSILGLKRTHPKAGITWKGWSQTTCHVLWMFTPKVTELTQKTRQRKSPNASKARRAL